MILIRIFFIFNIFFIQELHAKKKQLFLPKTFSVSFTQEYTSILKGIKKSVSGSIDYRYPGHIKFVKKETPSITYINNPIKSWYYVAPILKGEPGEVTVSRGTKRDAYTKFFDILSNGMVNNRYYKVKKNSQWEFILTFSKKGIEKTRVRESKIIFSNKLVRFETIRKLKITFDDSKIVNLTFNKIKVNPKFARDYFVFKIPPNTRGAK